MSKNFSNISRTTLSRKVTPAVACLPPFLVVVNSKVRISCQGSKFFLLRVNPLWKSFITKSQKLAPFVNMTKNMRLCQSIVKKIILVILPSDLPS